MIALKLENIDKSFGGITLFKKVNLELEKGTINALFGGNGAGKTTLFNIIGGYDNQDKGHIWYNNVLLKKERPYQRANLGISKMWQTPQIFKNHSLIDNMLVSNKMNLGDSFLKTFFQFSKVNEEDKILKNKAVEILRSLNLLDKEKSLAGNLSFGETKLLSLAMLIMNNAELLLLDEAFSNVNTKTIDLMISQLEHLKDNGKTVFMIEHKINEAKKVSNFLYKVENKEIVSING